MGQQAPGGGQFAPAFGGFVNDHTAQLGFQLGKNAAAAGQEYVEQNVQDWPAYNSSRRIRHD